MQSTRPRFHVVAPTAWMNDPCAPCYNPKTKTFHLFYQWNPKATQWGDIAWGHVQSDDLLRWKYTHQEPVLSPAQPYDEGGVFTGCMHVDDSGKMTIAYTSARDLPIHWTREHKKGSESVSLATSTDNGKTWYRHASNPVVPHEPEGVVVTGFRDPYIARWTGMDRLLGKKPGECLYGLVSGGTSTGPTTFLFRIAPDDLTSWTFLGPLADLPRHHRIVKAATAPKLSDSADESRKGPDLGCNWECTTFVSLTAANGQSVNVLLPSSEGGRESERFSRYHASHPDVPPRVTRGANWLFGDLDLRADESPRFTPTTSGLLDHGSLYACTIFPHPDGRTILWGWMIEDDVDTRFLETKGWTGCLGVPREVFLMPLGKMTGISAVAASRLPNLLEVDNEWYTLGIRPIAELERLRVEPLFRSAGLCLDRPLLDPQSSRTVLDIQASVIVTETTVFTLHIKHNATQSVRTSIVFSGAAETISIDRSASTTGDGINTMDECGPFTLLQTDGVYEPLRLRVLIDGDAVEVFVNDRFALSTRTYAPAKCGGVSMALDGGGKVDSVGIWEMGSIGLETIGLETRGYA